MKECYMLVLKTPKSISLRIFCLGNLVGKFVCFVFKSNLLIELGWNVKLVIINMFKKSERS